MDSNRATQVKKLKKWKSFLFQNSNRFFILYIFYIFTTIYTKNIFIWEISITFSNNKLCKKFIKIFLWYFETVRLTKYCPIRCVGTTCASFISGEHSLSFISILKTYCLNPQIRFWNIVLAYCLIIYIYYYLYFIVWSIIIFVINVYWYLIFSQF